MEGLAAAALARVVEWALEVLGEQTTRAICDEQCANRRSREEARVKVKERLGERLIGPAVPAYVDDDKWDALKEMAPE